MLIQESGTQNLKFCQKKCVIIQINHKFPNLQSNLG